MPRKVRWSALAIEEAVAAMGLNEGTDQERMLAALDAAAEAQGLNGAPKRNYKKCRLSPKNMPKDKQFAEYRRIVREELEKFNLTWDMLAYGGQMRPVVDCRWQIIWRVRKETGMPFPALGKLLDIDHSTAVNAFQRMEKTGGTYYTANPISERKRIENRRKLRDLDRKLQEIAA